MPRIDPNQLLKCLSVLLSPSGGIRSKDEVQRIASLMTKFSKKLVSKCIYVLILKTTEADLLDMFMSAGGWDLTFNWLSDGIQMENWPLVLELVELLLLCPVDIERLKGNNCPKAIKMLSKEPKATEKVRVMACNVVEQWLAVVKGACEASTSQGQTESSQADNSDEGIEGEEQESREDGDKLPLYKITICEGKKVLAEVISDRNTPRVDRLISEEGEEGKSSDESISDKEPSEDKIDELEKIDKSSADKSVQKQKDSSKSDSKKEPKKTTVSRKKNEKKTETDEKDKNKKKMSSEKRYKLDLKAKLREKERMRDKEREKEREREKEKNMKEKSKQEEKDRAVLSKLLTPSLTNVGKIPKKLKDDLSKKEKTKDEEKTDDKDKVNKKPVEPKKPPPQPKDPKKYNISVEVRKGGEERPKTVKTFNSKFRSTGLEELPPPPKNLKKTDHKKDEEDKKSLKRPSPSKETHPPEKKLKEDKEDKAEKPAVKPKALGLQESDVFADALTAANPIKDIRKRKRRPSTSVTEVKKEAVSPPVQNKPEDPKPVFKFYQDTLITSEDKKDDSKDETILKVDEDTKMEVAEVEQFSKEEIEDEVAKAEEAINEVLKREEKKNLERERNRLPKGVLVYVKKEAGVKKGVQWKPEAELEAIKYFELDENERVNVTKAFSDMKQMERINERMHLSRKLAMEDIMEEKTPWRPLIPIDIEGDLVIPGKNSIEKEIQQARERTTLQAIYFNKSIIPDSPAEPDLEIHAMTEPTIIPLDDQTGNTDSVISYKDKPWPEPKGYEPGTLSRPSESPPHLFPPQELQQQQQQPPAMMGPPSFPPGPFPPVPYSMASGMMPGQEWMVNGEGNIMGGGDNNMMMMGPGMNPGMPNMNPGMPPNMHPGMMGPPDMFQGPPDMMPQFFGPPPGMFGGPGGPGPFQGPNGPIPMQQDIRPPRQQWFRQNGGPPGGGGGNWRHPNKNNNKGSGNWKPRGMCNNFMKKGFCRVPKCPFKHQLNKNR
ncbi:serine/threonine-protein phosphatase 1 regulatory subunit 10-like isoform X1 [Cimex lectularius]|uniref:Serine/threonine-protein phosphatase 1 regulatory subunit 10 n=2 Tax=Cimex lectularius TaxID=79782 RepID=A0A8I6SAD3_CIMLE|nr:serine/threonine-protein phosphatase 1 regulatory subunit 10-like isoform X1 [Cimex lectularius]